MHYGRLTMASNPRIVKTHLKRTVRKYVLEPHLFKWSVKMFVSNDMKCLSACLYKTWVIFTLSQYYRPGSIMNLGFSRALDLVEQSKAMSEVGDLFMSNPIDINGESMTVMQTPLYMNTKDNLTQSMFHTQRNRCWFGHNNVKHLI